jgi:glycine/D-amino acid oxidase-like deaminating enzyme
MAGVDYQLSLSREHEVVVSLPEAFGRIPIVSDVSQGIHFRPYGASRLLIGEGYPKEREPCDPDTYDQGAGATEIARMLERVGRRVPAVTSPPVVAGYAGVYSITDDWYPIVGDEPGLAGYYAAVGGSGHCFKIGPPIGEALADVICGAEPQIDIASLHHARFARDETFASVWGPGNRG